MKNNIQKFSTFFSNGLVYGLNGIFTIFPLYLAQYFDSVQMGYLLAIPPLVLCLAPLFWGKVSDKASSQNNVMILLIVGATLSYCLVPLIKNFYYVAILLTLYAFFQSSFGSLIDVLTIRSAEKFKVNYGFFRTNGAFLYGFMTFFVTIFAKVETSFYIFAIVALLACVCVYLMPKVSTKRVVFEKKEKKQSVLKNKELWFLIAVIAPAYFAWGYYHNFFPSYITETLGLNKSVWGIVAFLTAFSELPFFFYYNRIFNKFRLKHILTLSLFVLIIRYIIYTFVTNVALLIVVSFVTGLFITVLIYCITRYIVMLIAPEFVNRAQSMAYAFGTGIPKVLAGCFGGYMTKFLGEVNSFLLCAGLIFLGLMLIFIFKRTIDSIDEKLFFQKTKG